MKHFIVKIGLVLLGLVAINVLGSYFFHRFDLTADKRFSVSEPTQNLLSGLEKEISVKVYLDGDLPAGFRKLKNSVRETLDDFQVYGGKNLNYHFVDIEAEGDVDKKKQNIENLLKKGLIPTNVISNEGGKRTERLVFPYAIVSYEGKEKTVLLLKGSQADKAEEKLNQSAESMEYELALAIQNLTQTERPNVGILTEFTRISPMRLAGMITALQERYNVFFLPKLADAENIEGVDAIILAKPDVAIDDESKYKIDQYVVNGGKALFFIDALKVENVGEEGSYAQPFQSNLDDLFFKYGIRINQNLIKDGISCASIPLNVGNLGDKANIQFMPYRYFPLINHFGNSNIVKNLDLISTKFVSSIDTVKASGIQKTPLLLTSPYTKLMQAPAVVSYNEARKDVDPNDYKNGTQSMAYLLEGKFQSVFRNRLLATDPRFSTFKETGEASKVIVCADGDMMTNDIDPKTEKPLPLGFDRYSQHTFGNRDFLMNALDYLLDDQGVIRSRNKDIQLRPLDKVKVKQEKIFWQAINIALPLVLLALFALLWFYFRKKRYQ